jgi:hypothetical protein
LGHDTVTVEDAWADDNNDVGALVDHGGVMTYGDARDVLSCQRPYKVTIVLAGGKRLVIPLR